MSKKAITKTMIPKKEKIKEITPEGKVVKKSVFKDSPYVVPKKKNKVLCIILCENKINYWIWRDKKDTEFAFKGSLYFILDTYRSLNGIEFCLYMEGVSTPITHLNIEKKRVEKTITNPVTGKPEKHFIDIIKGLKFDSKILYMLLNRGLFRELTKAYLDVPNLLIILLIVGAIILGVINLVVGLGVING